MILIFKSREIEKVQDKVLTNSGFTLIPWISASTQSPFSKLARILIMVDVGTKESSKRYSLLSGERILGPKSQKEKNKNDSVACFLHSLEEENDPNKLGLSHCSGSLSLVPKAPESTLPGTC